MTALFVRLRARFAAEYPSVADAELHLEEASGSAFRDLARASQTSMRITVRKRILRMEDSRIAAVLAHELAHLADPHFHLSTNAEHRADRIVKRVLGKTVRYDEGEIQNFARGGKRPGHLAK